MGSSMTCKLNPCCGDRLNCTPPHQYYDDKPTLATPPDAEQARLRERVHYAEGVAQANIDRANEADAEQARLREKLERATFEIVDRDVQLGEQGIELVRLRERVAELEAELVRARLLADHERERFFAAEARLAQQAERARAVTEAMVERAYDAFMFNKQPGFMAAIRAALEAALAEPQQAVTEAGDWAIDQSTGTDILTYKQCSVIEDEQAHFVLGLVEAALRTSSIGGAKG